MSDKDKTPPRRRKGKALTEDQLAAARKRFETARPTGKALSEARKLFAARFEEKDGKRAADDAERIARRDKMDADFLVAQAAREKAQADAEITTKKAPRKRTKT